MRKHSEKNKEKKIASSTGNISKKTEGQTAQFVNKRPEASLQRKIQTIADNSPQIQNAIQLQAIADNGVSGTLVQKKENKTGLPDRLKAGVENISGHSLDDVKVHYNSSMPAQLNAHAYAQGSSIHLGPGQEKHLPHETWHVVQQKQGRVQPNTQVKGININDDKSLEAEADLMGSKAISTGGKVSPANTGGKPAKQLKQVLQRVQMQSDIEFDNAGKLIVQGQTNPANKAAALNNLYADGAVTDASVNAHYHNGHMVAAMFGGANNGNNIRVWSDGYEGVHDGMEKQVRYGGGPVAAPTADEKGTVKVVTTDQNNKYGPLVQGLYNTVKDLLDRPGYWRNGNVPANPLQTITNGLNGAHLNTGVNAIPTQVNFKYDDTAGNRSVDVTTNANIGNPVASANTQHVLTSLGRYVNTLVPSGMGRAHQKSPAGIAHNALLDGIRTHKF